MSRARAGRIHPFLPILSGLSPKIYGPNLGSRADCGRQFTWHHINIWAMVHLALKLSLCHCVTHFDFFWSRYNDYRTWYSQGCSTITSVFISLTNSFDHNLWKYFHQTFIPKLWMQWLFKCTFSNFFKVSRLKLTPWRFVSLQFWLL